MIRKMLAALLVLACAACQQSPLSYIGLGASTPTTADTALATVQTDVTQANTAVGTAQSSLAQANKDIAALQKIIDAAPPTPVPTSAGLTVVLSGDMYQGDPLVTISVDGAQQGGTVDITAHHSQGTTQTVSFPGPFNPSAAHAVVVTFANDGWAGSWANNQPDGSDRNVYIESVTLNGVTVNGIAGNNSSGTSSLTHTATEAAMCCNGTAAFAFPATTSAFFVAPGGNDLASGTAATPFASVGRCQAAMANSPAVKNCNVSATGGGYYDFSTCSIGFDVIDDGEVWVGDSNAVLDGGGKTSAPFIMGPATNITLTGFKLQNFTGQ
jgi:hypothetical protein